MLRINLLNNTLFLIVCTIISLFSSCNKSDEIPITNELNLSDEVNIAMRIHDIIVANEDYNVLTINESAENYLKNKIEILTECQLVEHHTYDWKVFVMDSENTNAFTIPGGYIYFDKGLLKVIDSEASFMNLLANEVGYADKGYANAKLQDSYGLSLLFDLALGSTLNVENELLNTLYNQAYTSDIVEEADDYMLGLACEKGYDPAKLSGFLNTLEVNDMLVDWLDTHPTNSLTDRIENFENYNCDIQNTTFDDPYSAFKEQLN